MPNLDRRFWILHAWLPLAAFAVLATLLATTDIDPLIADRFFFDWQAHRFIGRDSWWARDLIHNGGRDVVRAIAAVALGLLAASFLRASWRHWRRPAAFVVTCMVGATLFVGTLKQLTNVDCPWDLARYGGTRPFVHIFADRPDDLPHAACFPGAHSASGFALVCFYFLLRGRRPVTARAALAGALATWATFAFGQQARGAHFVSHDLWSAALVWFICLGLYVLAWKARVMPGDPRGDRPGDAPAGRDGGEALRDASTRLPLSR
jgi:membrane-associated PAP2 superfamily phosphatase